MIETGCPSGLQPVPVSETDPNMGRLDLSAFVKSRQDGTQELDLIVQGAHCGGCLSKIETGLSALPGLSSARMNLTTKRLRTAWQSPLTASDIVSELDRLGYGAAPYETDKAQEKADTETRTLLKAMAVAGFAAMNVMLLSISVWSGTEMSQATRSLLHWLSAVIALPTVIYSGRPFFRSALGALKRKQTNMDVPISLALILACALSLYETVKGNPDTYFDAAVMLLFLLLIGRYLDARLRRRTGDVARQLAALQTATANRIIGADRLETIPATQVKPGDRLLIPVGQRIAVDGKIIDGTSDIDLQIATGETRPRLHAPGDSVYSGTINLSAPLTIEATAAAHDSFLSEISNLVEMGEQKKSRYVRLADRAARAYVPVVHTLAALTFIGWLLVGAPLRPAAINAIAVLIITCPCALGLAVPAVQIVASGRLFKHGILIKSGDALERLAKVRHVIFDKTGTLTLGQMLLSNPDDIPQDTLEVAAALARHSRHPVARALHSVQTDIIVTDVREIPGSGVMARIDGAPVRFGSASFCGLKDSTPDSWLAMDESTPIRFTFIDRPRSDARSALEKLSRMHISTELLTGDHDKAAQDMAEMLGLPSWKAGVTPGEKLDIVEKRQTDGLYPMMVGDGINDAPALASAYTSASPASAADISRTASDIILQGNRLDNLPVALQTAQTADRRVRENLALAIIYNMIAVPLAVFGFVNPLIAALAMSGSSLLVTLNALRMARS